LTTFKSSSDYHVGFSIKGDVEVGGEVGGEVVGEVGGEDGGENGDDNGGKDGTHTNPICFDYQILFGNSIIPMIPTQTNPYQPIPTHAICVMKKIQT